MIPWPERLAEGWTEAATLAKCIRCHLVTVARDPRGNPHHAVCPRDIKIPARSEFLSRLGRKLYPVPVEVDARPVGPGWSVWDDPDKEDRGMDVSTPAYQRIVYGGRGNPARPQDRP